MRMNLKIMRNKFLGIFYMFLVLYYPPLGSNILKVFACKEIGAKRYLMADMTLVCYTAEHTKWRLLGVTGVLGFIVGLPIFFFLRIQAGRMFVVREKWAVLQLRTEMSRTKLATLLLDVRARWEDDGRNWTPPLDLLFDPTDPAFDIDKLTAYERQKYINKPLEDTGDTGARMFEYLQTVNHEDPETKKRIGFIYKDYCERVYWFELVEMVRKLLLSGTGVFLQGYGTGALQVGLSRDRYAPSNNARSPAWPCSGTTFHHTLTRAALLHLCRSSPPSPCASSRCASTSS
jgi:hypothetical protein